MYIVLQLAYKISLICSLHCPAVCMRHLAGMTQASLHVLLVNKHMCLYMYCLQQAQVEDTLAVICRSSIVYFFVLAAKQLLLDSAWRHLILETTENRVKIVVATFNCYEQKHKWSCHTVHCSVVARLLPCHCATTAAAVSSRWQTCDIFCMLHLPEKLLRLASQGLVVLA